MNRGGKKMRPKRRTRLGLLLEDRVVNNRQSWLQQLTLVLQSIAKRPTCQEESPNCPEINDLHPLLVGDFKPDVRPFEWPERPRRRQGPEPVQLDLFGENTNE